MSNDNLFPRRPETFNSLPNQFLPIYSWEVKKIFLIWKTHTLIIIIFLMLNIFGDVNLLRVGVHIALLSQVIYIYIYREREREEEEIEIEREREREKCIIIKII